jgi:hypothetical protein
VLAAVASLCVAMSGLLFSGTVIGKVLIVVGAIAAVTLLVVSLNRTDRDKRGTGDASLSTSVGSDVASS